MAEHGADYKDLGTDEFGLSPRRNEPNRSTTPCQRKGRMLSFNSLYIQSKPAPYSMNSTSLLERTGCTPFRVEPRPMTWPNVRVLFSTKTSNCPATTTRRWPAVNGIT